MDNLGLRELLVPRGHAHHYACIKLSATKYIRASDWAELKRFEQEYLKCYAVATAAHKAILVGRSAARVAELWVLPLQNEAVELANKTGRPPSTKQWPKGVIYRNMAVARTDYQEFLAEDGTGGSVLRMTTVERTIVDTARLHGLRHGVVALDSLLKENKAVNAEAQRKSIESTIDRLEGKKGIGRARRALALSSGLSESPYESLFRIILSENGIQVQPQMWIGHQTRVDLLWEQLVIEIDGESKYEDVPHQTVMRQLKRENWLKEQGYEVLRLFPAEILRDEQRCIERVVEAKARADARGPVRVPASQDRPL
ncbi:endonuclease domain-containing protein [Corynebacterium appendicis]|uniref:endonuclease domain-containing protein n=1 Tax=Corynebacterium appendicis TaxID=163202 RepID=UPI002352134B|nr:DUF559 domain-containing protein [Corynebacterium appendicis]